MLRNAIENYLKSVTELNFFTFFQCILEKKGYTDIHFTHGIVEFGKDFICKKDDTQYVIQLKAKDIDLNTFRKEINPQLVQAVTEKSSHPNLDLELDYKVIFVTTGRLNSPTQASFTLFNNYVEDTLKSNKIECWDYDTLIHDIFSSSVEKYLYDNAESQKIVRFFKMLSILEGDDDIDWFDIEEYTFEWLSETNYNKNEINILLESSFFTNTLLKNKNNYHALIMQISLLRYLLNSNIYKKYESTFSNNLKHLIQSGIDLYQDKYKKRTTLTKPRNRNIAFFEYPKNCLRFLELLSLNILIFNNEDSKKTILDIVSNEPGSSYYISENYMVSFNLISLALIKIDQLDVLKKYIINTTIFLCDRYQEFGLSTAGSSSSSEISQLLSEYLEGYEYQKNNASQLAGLILYVVNDLYDSDFYNQISNELKAVHIILSYIHVTENDAVFLYNHESIFQTFDNNYSIVKTEKYSLPIIAERDKSKINKTMMELVLSSIFLRDRFYMQLFGKTV